MSQKALDLLKGKFGEAVLDSGTHRGDEWAIVRPDAIVEIAAFLRDAPELDMKLLADITAVDYLFYDPDRPLAKNDPQRFEVVYHFASVSNLQRVRLKLRCGEQGQVPSLTALYKTADWWERLVYDFYGIRFSGHPNLKRILLYEEFKGHPLQKDYPIHKRQPLVPEKGVRDLVRGPGPGESEKHAPFSQRGGHRRHVKSDAYD